MPQSYEAGLPAMILTDDYQIAFEARDATGAAVSGVKIAAPMIFGEIEGAITLEQLGPFMFVPGPTPSS